MSRSETELIAGILRGEHALYSQIVERYQDRVMTLAVRMLKNRQDAEEAVQDTFVRAYNALAKFQGASKFGTWLYRIAYNVCLSRLRKESPAFHEVELSDEHSASPEGLLSSLEEKDMVGFIRRCMEELPAKYSTILSLFYLQDLTHEEICQVTELPLGTVKVQLHRARALLYSKLQQEFQLGKAI